MDNSILTLLISTLFSFLVSYITIQSNENKSLKEEVNKKKKDIYYKFVVLLTDYISNKEKYDDEKLKSEMGGIRRDLMIYASKDVLMAFNNWTKSANGSEGEVMSSMDRILYEMRKDIGINDGKWQEKKPDYTRVQTLIVEDLTPFHNKKKRS